MKRKHYKEKEKTEKLRTVSGRITLTASGFGFISVQGCDNDFFVPPQFTGGAMDRDVVSASIFKDGRSERPIAKVEKILERGRSTVCGEIIAGRKLRPLSKRVSCDITVSGNMMGAKKGDWVELTLDDDSFGEFSAGRVRRVIGEAGNLQADLSAIASEYDIAPPYTADFEEEISGLKPLEIPREDLTSLFVCTVDPADAKDYDDAMSVKKDRDGNYELGVHIADVSAWVRQGEKLDFEASKRGFTAYLPGRTLPMLPKSLTSKMSLSSGKISLSHSIMIKVCGKTGMALSSRRCRSKIHVSARLTFDDLDLFIKEGQLSESLSESIGKRCEDLRESLSTAVELFRKMRNFRSESEEFLEIETECVRVLCDEGGNEIIGLRRDVQRDAEKFVEEFMLAANVEAAKEMLAKEIPGIYRVHPQPFPEKTSDFCEFMKDAFGLSPGDISSRKVCNKFLRSVPEDHRKLVIIDAFLRAMARAFYSEKNALHFGLGKSRYAHFTSPIRRYPDLIVHQQFMAYDGYGGLRSKKTVAYIAEDASRKEALNDEAFWAANDRLKLHFLREKLSGWNFPISRRSYQK